MSAYSVSLRKSDRAKPLYVAMCLQALYQHYKETPHDEQGLAFAHCVAILKRSLSDPLAAVDVGKAPGTPSWAVLGASWAVLGASWAVQGASWAVLGASWVVLGAYWAALGASWAALGASWAVLGAIWGPLGPKNH